MNCREQSFNLCCWVSTGCPCVPLWREISVSDLVDELRCMLRAELSRRRALATDVARLKAEAAETTPSDYRAKHKPALV